MASPPGKYVQLDGRWLTPEQAFAEEVGKEAFKRQRKPAKKPWNKRPPTGYQSLPLFGDGRYCEAGFSAEAAYREARRGD
jgi:hypothetical protein